MPSRKNFAFQLDCWSAQSSTSPPCASSGASHSSAVESATRDGDAELMLRAKSGDDAAFEALVNRYQQPLIGFFFRMVGDQSIAEELAQETFLRAYRLRKTYGSDAKFTTWIYRIATNLAINRPRDIRHERAKVVVSIEKRGEQTGSEQVILRRERLAAVRRHIDALPEHQRLAVLMHKYQGLDYQQIAEVLELSEAATRSLLFRAYETLQQKLKEYM